MPRSSGTYTAPASSWNPAVNGASATLADWNALLADLSSGLTQSVSKDGQTAMTGNLAMGSNKITGLAAGTTAGDSVRYEQATSAVAITGGTITNTPISGSTVAATTISASGQVSSTGAGSSFKTQNDNSAFAVYNTANSYVISIGTVKNWDGTGSVTDGALGTVGSNLKVYTNASTTPVGTFSSTGLAVTGALSATATGNSVSLSTATAATTYNAATVTNAGGSLYMGVDNSTGTAFSSSAYGGILGTSNATNLALITNGAVKATLDTSGNLGLGVTPQSWSIGKALDIGFIGNAIHSRSSGDLYMGVGYYFNGGYKYATSGALAALYEQNAGVHTWFNAPSGTAGNALTWTQAMTLDASGILSNGIFNSTSGLQWTVSVANQVASFRNTHATTPNGLYVYYSSSAPNGVGSEFFVCGDTGATRATIRSNGGLANFSANNVNLSDIRTKKDIADAPSYLDRICAIPVRTFLYKDQTDTQLNLGVIAQEVEAVCPELVSNDGFGETPADGIPLKSIYQTDLQYALMKCIQEQQAQITALTQRLAAAGIA